MEEARITLTFDVSILSVGVITQKMTASKKDTVKKVIFLEVPKLVRLEIDN